MNTPRTRRAVGAGTLPGQARIWALPSASALAVPDALAEAPDALAEAPPRRPLDGPHREAEVRRRARGDAFGQVGDALRVSVALAACRNPEALPLLVESLAAQRDEAGSPFERGEAEALVALLADEAAVGADLAARYPWLRTTVVARLPAGAGPEWTCQLAMDAACVRLLAAGRPEGLVLTTARPQPPDWLASATAAADAADAWFAAAHDLDAGLAVSARAYAHVGGLRLAGPSAGAAFAEALGAAGARVGTAPGAHRRAPIRPALALSS